MWIVTTAIPIPIPFWLKEIRDNSNERVKIIIVGNKADLLEDREVPLEEAKAFARARDFYYMEVSAKTNMNNCVNVAFEELVKSVLSSLKPEELTNLRHKSTIRKNFQSELESAKKKDQGLQHKKCCQYL